MADLKETLFRKLYNVALTNIETVKIEDKSIERIKLSVESALQFLQQPKEYPFKDKLILQLFETISVKSSSSAIIKSENDHVDWYDKNRSRPYWETYREYLKNDKQFSPDAVSALDKTTDLMMKYIENPGREGAWDSRGLIVGSVQSGKTSNFIGFLNKAVDAGYKKIVILSGLNKNLRQQTQLRIDEGLLGYDTASMANGVRDLKGPLARKRMLMNLNPIHSATNSKINGDFKSSAAEHFNVHTNEPTVFVVKKNKSILESVLKYFLSAPTVHGVSVDSKPFKIKGYQGENNSFIKDKPILVIDDEVDNGSVDTGEQSINEKGEFDPDYDPKTINSRIRQILNIFEKKVYIGYTATPFANIFIHHEKKTREEGLDLFPKDYIIDLPIPSNHIGLEKIFNIEKVDGDIIEDREIEDNYFFKIVKDSSLFPDDPDCAEGWIPPRHDRYHTPKYEYVSDDKIAIPPSLKEAIISFILTSACRNFRGYIEDAKSMLIHVSKFQDVQNIVYKQVGDYLNVLRDRIQAKHYLHDDTISKFEDIWHKNFYIHKDKTDEKTPTWQELLDHKHSLKFVINEVCQNIKVLNGKSNDTLDYDDFFNANNFGLHTIIIGGDKLSRGITLEGLSISYFLRSAKMPMYDTLMQMGRWFGYRMGYEDLCRLYTTDNVIRWFFHISVATEEMRNTFRIMANQGATPLEFGLKVRTNPNLIITSKTKMRNARKERTSFSQEVEEIITYVKDDQIIKSNYEITNKFLLNIKEPTFSGEFDNGLQKWKNSYVWKDIEAKNIITFLSNYKKFPDPRSLGCEEYVRYINNLNTFGELTNWTVCLHGSGSSKINKKFADKYNVELLLRTPSNQKNEKKISLKVITQPRDELIGLEGSEIEAYKTSLQNFTKTHNQETDGKTILHAGRQLARYHRSEKRGLLNIYPILGVTNLSSYKKYKGYKDSNDNKIEGHHDIEKIDPDHLTKQPLIGFQLSFPISKMGDRACIEYMVNSVYSDSELV
ncbi:Z1 domain-containing protein [Candidatus Pelagibacter bacterium]|nr:Z1 domain-containing protein [Candidatus Pelagibacter bacterium]MDA8845119.1 Z1 domain-containing protein [Candidatus Pelagibacter bacterium]